MTDYSEIDRWLPEDLTGVAATNFVENEPHTVARSTTSTPVNYPNTFDASYGKTVIISPYCGAFYSTGLTVTLKNPNDPNDLGVPVDYRLVGMDVGRTRVTSCKGAGVYRFIHLTGDTNALPDGYQIIISYHAFGGEISSNTYQYLLELIRQAAQSGGSGGGGGGGEVSPEVVDALIDKVDRIATRINFNPTKGFVVRRQKTVSQWTTFAASSSDLDNYIDFSKPETLRGTGTFDIYSAFIHGTYHFTWEIVPGNSPKCKLTCRVENQKIMDLDPLTMDTDGFFSDGLAIPMFRMVYFNGTSTDSSHKLYLQVAYISNNATAANCNVLVSDKSDFVETAAGYNVNGQVFDAWDMYVSGIPNTSIYFSNHVLGLEDYFKIWEGNASLAVIEDVSWTRIQVNHDYNVQSQLVPSHTDKGYVVFPFVIGQIMASAIKSFRVDIYDRYEEKLITATCLATASKPYAASGASEVYGCVNYFMYDNCLLELFYTYDGSNNKSTIRLYSNSGNSSYLNKRFDLRAIYVK